MRVDGQPIPIHLAKAYGLSPRVGTGVAGVAGPAGVTSAAAGGGVGAAGSVVGGSAGTRGRNPKIDLLVGAVVPGRIDFSGSDARPSVEAGGRDSVSWMGAAGGRPDTGRREATAPAAVLPFYMRPGDRNLAATALQVGRRLDVQG